MKTQNFKPPRSITRIFPQVTRVIHAKKHVIVEVSSKDCKEGKGFQTNECALAKAAKRQFKADGVAIRLSDSFVIKGKTAIRFMTPETVKRELVSFDRHHDFAPGIYRLSPAPPQWSKSKIRGVGHSHKGGHNRKTNTKVHRTVRVRTTNSEQA